MGKSGCKNFLKFFISLFFLLLPVNSYGDTDYYFSVPEMDVKVTVNQDSSIKIDYEIEFYCDVTGKAIDVVDIGFPTEDYDINSVTAQLKEKSGILLKQVKDELSKTAFFRDIKEEGFNKVIPLHDIRKSEYIDIGVEIHLGEHSIGPGSSAVLVVSGINKKMVFEDTSDKNYASVVFSPTWFGENFVTGTTNLKMTFIFPPGVKEGEGRWHENHGGRPQNIFFEEERLHYEWNFAQANPSRQYFFGISFPKKLVSSVRPPHEFAMTGKSKFKKMWKKNLSGDKTFSIVAKIFLAVIIVIIIEALKSVSSGKMKYLPPSIKIEGAGIRRGLTAPEAAVLMEMPLNKILTMILFGLLKKGAVKIKSHNPLRLEENPELVKDLREYEKWFIRALDIEGKLLEGNLRETLIELINSVERKMKGFSYRETIEYYRSIVSRGWDMVLQSQTPELKIEEWTKNLEWILMDKNFADKTKGTFAGESVVRTHFPIFWSDFHPSETKASSSPSQINLPVLPGADFANMVVSRIENISERVVSKLSSFSEGVTKVTNPAALKSSGGGGGRGCACACAGCACACAGGGR